MIEPLEQKYKIMALVQFISAAALLVFWSGYYLLPLLSLKKPVLSIPDTAVLPFPDTLLFVLMTTAGLTLLKRRISTGKWLTFITGFALVLLGIAGFDFELGGQWRLISMVTLMKSGFVHLWCVVFGLYFLLKLKGRKPRNRVNYPAKE